MPDAKQQIRRTYSVAEIAERNGCSKNFIYKLIQQGTLEARRIGDQHIIHGLGDFGMAREFGAFGAHPNFEVFDKGRNLFPDYA